MPQNHYPRDSVVGAALNKFERNGPYTLEKVQRLASLSYRHRNEDITIGESLKRTLNYFSEDEFSKLVTYHSEALKNWKQNTVWIESVGEFTPIVVTPDTPHEHLVVMSKFEDIYDDFREYVLEELNVIKLTPDAKLELLVALREQVVAAAEKRKEVRSKNKADGKQKRRDKSPKRQ